MRSILKTAFFITRKERIWSFVALVGCVFFFLATFIVHNSFDQRMLVAMDLIDSSQAVELVGLPYLSYCERLIGSDTIIMFTSVFSIMLMLVEFRNGYIKNMWTSIERKWQFLVSKYVVLILFIVFMFIVSGAIIGISNFIYLDCSEFGNVGPFIKFLLVQLFLQFSICSLVMCLALIIRQRAIIMVATIIYVTFAPQMIYGAINYLAIKLFDVSNDFLVQKFLPYGNVELLTTLSKSDEYLRVIVVGLVSLVVSTIISVLILKKRDIR